MFVLTNLLILLILLALRTPHTSLQSVVGMTYSGYEVSSYHFACV